MQTHDFDAIDGEAISATEDHIAAAVEGDHHAERVVREAAVVLQITRILRRVRVTPGDQAVLASKVTALRGLASTKPRALEARVAVNGRR